MRRLLATLACCALSTLLRGEAPAEGVPALRDPPARLALRVAHLGTVESCPDCVLIELREGPTRSAYFVKAETPCALDPSEAFLSRVDLAASEAYLEIEYSQAVRAQIVDCLGARRESRVLVSVDGVPAGVAFLGLGQGGLFFVGSRELERVQALIEGALRSERVEREIRVAEDTELSLRLLEIPPGQRGFLRNARCDVVDAPIYQQGGFLSIQVEVESPRGRKPIFSYLPREPGPFARGFQDRLPLEGGEVITFSCRSFLDKQRRGPSGGCSVDLELELVFDRKAGP